MRKSALLLLMLFALLAGCGGGGGSALPSPFAGAWTGTMVLSDGSGSSSPSAVLINVDSKGRISGSWEDPLSSGTLTGSVANGGHATLGIGSAGPPPVTMPCEGESAITAAGNWQGTLPVVGPGGAGMSAAFDVNRQ